MKIKSLLILALSSIMLLSGCASSNKTSSIQEATNQKELTYKSENDLIGWLKESYTSGSYYIPTQSDNVKLKQIKILGYVAYDLSVKTADGKTYDCTFNWMLSPDGNADLQNTIDGLSLKNWYEMPDYYTKDENKDPNSIYWVYDRIMFQLIAPKEMGREEIAKLFSIEKKTF